MKFHRIINSYHTSNTYIIYNESDKAYLIDCGDADKVIEWLAYNNKRLGGVFLTHTHYDHIYGLNDLLNVFYGLKVYTSCFGFEALKDTRKNISYYLEKEFVFNGDNIKKINSNDSVILWENSILKVVETPGHNESSLSFMVNNLLFTGDSYIPGTKVITSLPNSNKEKAIMSEKLILSLVKNNTIICPGHGEVKRTCIS